MNFFIPTLKDIIDILLVSAILYRVMKTLKRRGGYQILIGFFLVLIIYLVSVMLEMTLLMTIFKLVRDYWFIAFVVIFQPEIREMIKKYGEQNFNTYFLPRKKFIYSPLQEAIMTMSFRRTGALILIEGKQKLNDFITSGETIEAKLSAKLLLTIFNRKTVLHDGAVIIRDDRIHAVKVVLPLSQNVEFVQKFGTRHLAAIGATEASDALAIIVSEETGKISYALGGAIETDITKEKLAQVLADATR